ncbi:hypothetical protein FAUST_2852 [Fusarium austroamericanum]|uniref:Uncharacterized protein n=1 Tax=Fusarium austroamericanum TaxID=282268 RepID=A0AAN6C657_FUSAU|nr:hypothetical protein FAUST_2852 [Fusarium austroamericanum]
MGEKRRASQDLPNYRLPVDNGDTNQPTATTSTLIGPAQDDVARDRHYAELYAKAPDFQQLALQDTDFARLWNQHKSDFFNDPECVTNRHNYILWLKRLLDTSTYEKHAQDVVGLDIERNWSFIATDIDSKSLEYARKNVTLNNLDQRIKVIDRKWTDNLIPLDELHVPRIAFTMSNPPFYKSEQELVESAKKKSQAPFTACTGAKVEMITTGGEVAFVDRILNESLVLRDRVQWYTSMFGFQSSLVRFVDKLKENNICNYAVTEFVQGSQTRRWAIAWSFGSMRPSQDVARGTKNSLSKNALPDITEETVVDLPFHGSISNFADQFRAELGKLELLSWEWDAERLEGTGRAAGRVWARAWRRKKQRADEEDARSESTKCVFAFRVSIRFDKDFMSVSCRWLEGHDPVTFDSFRGHVKKTVKSIFVRSVSEMHTSN